MNIMYIIFDKCDKVFTFQLLFFSFFHKEIIIQCKINVTKLLSSH